MPLGQTKAYLKHMEIIIFIGLAKALSLDLRDLVPWWPLQTLDFGPDSELADGQSSSPIRSARAIENVM